MKDDKDQEYFSFDITNKPRPSTLPVPALDIDELYKKRQKETWQERCLGMLKNVKYFCQSCSMCELGRKACTERDTTFDPHVFSNMQPSQFMVVGQGPGFNECLKTEPFIGDAGKFFDKHLAMGGVKREQFYITNATKCHVLNNEAPTPEQLIRCEPILKLEIGILRPKLIITLGNAAFSTFCPDQQMNKCFGKIITSAKFSFIGYIAKVYPVYHPSPRNMQAEERKTQFTKDMAMLCKIIRKLTQSH
jgi:DNA polymerase